MGFGSAKGQPQGDLSFCGDADGAGFAAAVDDLAGKFIKFALVFDTVYAFHSCDYIMEKREKQAARLYTFPQNGYNMSVTGGMDYREKAGDWMPTGIEVTKAALDDFKKIQDYMLLARKENAVETYAKLKDEYLTIKALLSVSGVNLADIDKIKE